MAFQIATLSYWVYCWNHLLLAISFWGFWHQFVWGYCQLHTIHRRISRLMYSASSVYEKPELLDGGFLVQILNNWNFLTSQISFFVCIYLSDLLRHVSNCTMLAIRTFFGFKEAWRLLKKRYMHLGPMMAQPFLPVFC